MIVTTSSATRDSVEAVESHEQHERSRLQYRMSKCSQPVWRKLQSPSTKEQILAKFTQYLSVPGDEGAYSFGFMVCSGGLDACT